MNRQVINGSAGKHSVEDVTIGKDAPPSADPASKASKKSKSSQSKSAVAGNDLLDADSVEKRDSGKNKRSKVSS